MDSHVGGFGVTAERTLLFNWFLDYNAGGDRSWDNESHHRVSWLTWSDDQGKSWSASELLDPSPYQNIADGVRPVPIGDARFLLPMCATACVRPGQPITVSDTAECGILYESSDDGLSWSQAWRFVDHCSESEILELPSVKMRLQLVEVQARDRCFTPDGVPDSNLDETLALLFGRWGQRFVVFYDEGETRSNGVYELNRTREYTRPVSVLWFFPDLRQEFFGPFVDSER